MNRRLVSILGVLLIIGCMFCLTGCFSKEAISAQTFKDKMQGAGYTINDISDQYEDTVAESAILAIDSTGTYQIEFFVQNSVDQAQRSLNNNLSTMNANKGKMSSRLSMTGQNYQKETLESDGQYWVVCQVDNTMVFAHVSSADKEAVNRALDLIGY